MKRGRPAPAAHPTARVAPAPAAPAPGLPLSHPALLAVALVAFALVALAVTFPIFDTDFWQHLAVGRAIWTTHEIPRTNVWTWPTYGAPQVLPSWGFRALLWPFWALAGETGLFVWRWGTTLAAFGLGWAAARRMGARGLAPLVVIVVCALVYRQRSQVRPETLACVLLAFDVWLIERRRYPAPGGRDASALLVPAAWIWANVHLSYYLGLLLVAAATLDELVRRRGFAPPAAAGGRRPLPLVAILGAAIAVSFVNPFGARALAQPFEFLLAQRHELMFQNVGELGPIVWPLNLWNGLPLLLSGWPLAILARALAPGRTAAPRFDLFETLACALFTTLALGGARFVGFHAVAAAPYLGRALGAVTRAPSPRPVSPGARPAWAAALMCGGLVVIALPELARVEMRPGLGIEMRNYPVAACDFMAAAGVAGRGYNEFPMGGYLLWRFWPDSTRLPFMDIHQTGSPELRLLATLAGVDPRAWPALDRRYTFDWALLPRVPAPERRLLDVLDADTSWSLVFLDDAAALYVRRHGSLAALAARRGYRALPAGLERVGPLLAAAAGNDSLRHALARELAAAAASSRESAASWYLAGRLHEGAGEREGARAAFERAVAINPYMAPDARARLGRIALEEGRPADAVHELEAQQALTGAAPALDAALGAAWRSLGNVGRARAAWRRAVARDPANGALRDSLAALERAGGR